MIGFVFSDEGEAKTMYKKVTTRKADTGKSPDCPSCRVSFIVWSGKAKASSSSSSKKKKSAKGGKIDKSMISGPTAGSFKLVDLAFPRLRPLLLCHTQL